MRISKNILWYAIAFFAFAMWVSFAYGEWTCQQCVEVTTPNPTPTPTPTPTPPPVVTTNISMPSFQAPSAGSNGQAFTVTVTIRNDGSSPTGQFAVSIYFSNSTSLAYWNQLLGTQVVSLEAGQSKTLTFSGVKFYGAVVHNYYYLLGIVEGKTLNGRAFNVL